MLRWQTAGESHGEALVAMIEGLPAGVRISTDDIVSALARRRLGYGRGARMKFEQDKVRLLTGVRHGLTLGSPVAIEIANTEWPKWTEVMSADALDQDLPREGRNAPLSRPRPGHADLTGMRKYGFDDARPVLERSSARETASRVALGEVAKQFLDQAFGIRTVAHVVALGGVQTNPDLPLPTPDDLEALDASPVRTLDKEAEARIIERINEAKKASDTLGGAMKPIPSIPKALRTVDVLTGESAQAINQRSDSTAVPAASVVAEAMVRLTLAKYALDKFGGDSVAETRRNLESYLASWPEHMR